MTSPPGRLAEGAALTAAIGYVRQALRTAGIDPGEAPALIELATGWDRIAQIRDRDAALSAEAAHRLTDVTRKRLAGIPFARLTGMREFWSLAFRLSPATLDPRADSEALVEAALEMGPERGRLLDLGTGTGCLAIAVLHERPGLTGVAVDLSPEAAATARRNAAANGVGDRFAALAADWTTALAPEARFDLILSNPPYISTGEMATLDADVRDHDPTLALVAGADGHAAYRRLFPAIAACLADGGLAVVELASDRAAEIDGIARAAGLATVAVRNDLAGRPRALVLRHGA